GRRDGGGEETTGEAEDRRKTRPGRPHGQGTDGSAILSLVMARGTIAGLATRAGGPERSGPPAGSAPEPPPADPSNTTRLVHLDRITGEITPKSVVASPTGTVIANNMMYGHTSTLYDAESLELTDTVVDEVDLAEF